jgi:hypothetical protein
MTLTTSVRFKGRSHSPGSTPQSRLIGWREHDQNDANNNEGMYFAHQMSAFALAPVNRSHGRCPMTDASVALGPWIYPRRSLDSRRRRG